jgi:hypothetical protein
LISGLLAHDSSFSPMDIIGLLRNMQEKARLCRVRARLKQATMQKPLSLSALPFLWALWLPKRNGNFAEGKTPGTAIFWCCKGTKLARLKHFRNHQAIRVHDNKLYRPRFAACIFSECKKAHAELYIRPAVDKETRERHLLLPGVGGPESVR